MMLHESCLVLAGTAVLIFLQKRLDGWTSRAAASAGQSQLRLTGELQIYITSSGKLGDAAKR